MISMIIGGEKVPAFSATTLSIPATPKDNFAEIVENSRALYARPRTDVEAEIKEAVEQSEKYKKELSDSGRQEGISETSVIIPHNPAKKEQKPNKYAYKPKYPKKPVMSPNQVSGKKALGLKDLATLVEQNSDPNQQGNAGKH